MEVGLGNPSIEEGTPELEVNNAWGLHRCGREGRMAQGLQAWKVEKRSCPHLRHTLPWSASYSLAAPPLLQECLRGVALNLFSLQFMLLFADLIQSHGLRCHLRADKTSTNLSREL